MILTYAELSEPATHDGSPTTCAYLADAGVGAGTSDAASQHLPQT